MTQSVEEVLSRTKLYSDGQEYHMLRLPANGITLAAGIIAEAGNPFSALIVDKDEVSLFLQADLHQEFAKRQRQAEVSDQVYRLITFDAPLEPTLVGFIARISAVLADAGIPILTFAAYSRDHILVPAEYFEAGMRALQALQNESA